MDRRLSGTLNPKLSNSLQSYHADSSQSMADLKLQGLVRVRHPESTKRTGRGLTETLDSPSIRHTRPREQSTTIMLHVNRRKGLSLAAHLLDSPTEGTSGDEDYDVTGDLEDITSGDRRDGTTDDEGNGTTNDEADFFGKPQKPHPSFTKLVKTKPNISTIKRTERSLLFETKNKPSPETKDKPSLETKNKPSPKTKDKPSPETKTKPSQMFKTAWIQPRALLYLLGKWLPMVYFAWLALSYSIVMLDHLRGENYAPLCYMPIFKYPPPICTEDWKLRNRLVNPSQIVKCQDELAMIINNVGQTHELANHLISNEFAVRDLRIRVGFSDLRHKRELIEKFRLLIHQTTQIRRQAT